MYEWAGFVGNMTQFLRDGLLDDSQLQLVSRLRIRVREWVYMSDRDDAGLLTETLPLARNPKNLRQITLQGYGTYHDAKLSEVK